MEDDFALFDPLQPAPAPGPSPAPDQEKVRAGGGAGRDTSVVLEDWDLLGGGQEVSQEVRPGDNSSPGAGAGSQAAAAARSTTSFFLLDLDTNDGGAATLGAAVTATLASDHRADSAADSIDDDLSVASEVLSVAGDTLPLEAASDAQEEAAASDQPQSGFFFHSLLESDEPRGIQQTRARPSDTVPGVDSGASGDSAGVGDSSDAGPKFHIGSTVLSRDTAAVPAPAEAGLPSLLDVAIPQPSVRPDLVTQEATVTEVEVFTAEDAEDDSVDGCVISSNPVMDAEYKQLEDQLDNPSTSHQLEEPSYSDQLSEQLRPVFEMCDPNKEGLISIQHLQDMCRENGQVR